MDPRVLFHVDELGVVVRGWAHDAGQDTPAQVTLWIDGKIASQVAADEYRVDLHELGYRQGFCGFRFTVAEAHCDGQEHDVFLTLGDRHIPMLASTQRIIFVNACNTRAVEGALDAIDDRFVVTGWVCDIGEIREVDIEIGGKVIARGLAELPRPDLVLADKQGRGFRVQIRPELVPSPSASLHARCDGVLLSGSLTIEAEKRASISVEPYDEGRVKVTLSGWPVQQVELDVIVDGKPLSIVRLHRLSGVDESSLQLVGYWHASPELIDFRRHVLQFRGAGALTYLSSDPVIVRWPEYCMNIDQVGERSVTGWAFRKGCPESLRLGFQIENEPCIEARANTHRADVADALHLSHAQVGFQVQVGAPLEGRTLRIHDADNGTILAKVQVDDPSELLAVLGRVSFDANTLGKRSPRQLMGAARSLLPFQQLVSIDYQPEPGAGHSVGVDIIVPVYSGATETVECIESVLESKNLSKFRLVLVNDCSPDARITAYLRRVAERESARVILIERNHNGGFSEAVNIGMTVAGRRDVILLNADTVVHGDWVDRIVAAAANDPMIATVTPFSNNGEICSAPYLCKSVAVESRSQLSNFDRHAAIANELPVEVPVAVGYCMFIRRACIDEIGLFDAQTWGRGYGEEVDFCLKATARGWRHVLATNVFVVHRGGVSFGDEKVIRIQESSRKIAERYPSYDQLIQSFLRRDPPACARRRLNLSVLHDKLSRQRVLHVTHAFGGGTDRYVRDLAQLYAHEGFANLILRFDVDGRCVLEIDTRSAGMPGLFLSRHEERYHGSEAAELVRDLELLAPNQVHLHAPFGVSEEIMSWIGEQPIIAATIHDYAWICPRVTLQSSTGEDCSAVEKSCVDCTTIEGAHPGLRHVLQQCNYDIARYRDYFAGVLAKASRVYVGGVDVARRMREAGTAVDFRVVAHPYVETENRCSPFNPRSRNGVFRVAVIGSISSIKGFWQLVDCASEALKRRLPIEFLVFGDTEDNVKFSAYSNVRIFGRYPEGALHRILDNYSLDVALFLNQVPETFSYTLSASLERGLWPVVTDIGVPAERVRAAGFGDVVPLDIGADELLSTLLEIMRNQRKAPPPAPQLVRPKSLKEYQGG